MDDDTHIPNAIEFQVVVDELTWRNTLVVQCFDERMVAKAEVEAK